VRVNPWALAEAIIEDASIECPALPPASLIQVDPAIQEKLWSI
jgi:hypothetical protein